MIDFLKLPSPCYVLDETLLDRNLAVIDRVRRESGAEIIVALKACAMWSIFPELARKQVAQGATLLVNISNDAWFGRSSAPEQHLSLGILRAVEQRRWIARSTNTGISAFVDPTGAVVARSGLFKAESLSHPVVPLTEKSVFFTLEPWLPWAGLALFLTFFAPVLSRFRRHI